MRTGAMIATLAAMIAAGDVAHAEKEWIPDDELDEEKPTVISCQLGSEYDEQWSTARGFSATFGSMPAADVTLIGITLEYARRYGKSLVRGEYTYGMLTNNAAEDQPNGIMHRGELSLRVPVFGVGPRYDDAYRPGTFFVEAGIGHHWNRWRDGSADSRVDAAFSFGLMLSAGGARSLRRARSSSSSPTPTTAPT